MQEYKNKLSTALLSDILEDIGYSNQLLPIEIKPNFVEAKIFGRARTMTLKSITEKEDYREVYKGLIFLEQLVPGEILIVANGFADCAFFGELMSTLAKRQGIEGAIIDGVTRDTSETIKMQYPVFARNNYARDIKKKGIVDKTDISVKVGEATICKGDLILGDYDGVIVIPKTVESEVLAKAIKNYSSEQKIKEMINIGASVEELLKEFGEF